MLINFTARLVNINGEVIKHGDNAQSVGSIAIEALTLNDPQDKISGEEKMKRWKLACKIHGSDQGDITIDEAKIIKDLVGKYYGPIVVGQVWEALESAK